MGCNEQAVLKTLHYSALFHFPLTKDELWKFLLTEKQIPRKDFEEALGSLRDKVSIHDGYYCLAGNEITSTERKRRQIFSKAKLKVALQTCRYLAKIPTIVLIGVSGSVAVNNAKASDDIDIVVVTKKNTVFITRLIMLVILELIGKRRRRQAKHVSDKICLNLILDETVSSWPQAERDMYTAHEIVQCVPLFEREHMYERFLAANSWVEQFLPNAFAARHQKPEMKNDQKPYVVYIFRLLEPLARSLQLVFIRRHKTFEEVTSHRLVFFPYSYRPSFLRKLNLILKKAGLLTKL